MRSILRGLLLASLCTPVFAAEPSIIPALYLEIEQQERLTLSNLDPIPEDLGLAGASLAVTDNNTTGKFVGYRFDLQHVTLPLGDLERAKEALSQSGASFVLLDMSADDQIALLNENDWGEKTFFNVRAYDDSLRGEYCHASLFHSLPSYAMRTDALAQLALKKRWKKLALLVGNTVEDELFASAMRRSASKFGLKIQHEEQWLFDADMRRQAANELPLFSQKFGDYDALIVADEHNDFARYTLYNTWLPRPVIGGDGLMAVSWSRVVEQWGAAQLQSRFTQAAGRPMQAVDYAAWAALRAIDEAKVRTKLGSESAVRAYLKNDLSLAGFKGRPLSFRSWNGQLRQPIALVHSSALVGMAPLEGFLHARNELDSLGIDLEESKCKFGGGTT